MSHTVTSDLICRLLAAMSVCLLLFGAACAPTTEPAAAIDIQFSPSGLTLTGVPSAVEQIGISAGDGKLAWVAGRRRFAALTVPYAVTPGGRYRITLEKGGSSFDATAPANLSPALVASVDLGGRFTSQQQGDTVTSAAAISADGRYAAVGSSAGDIILFDMAERREWPLRQPGSYVRSLAFSAIGERLLLFAGEQSPSGTLRSWTIGENGPEESWRRNTADEIGIGALDPDDPFAWAHQPGVYRCLPAGEDLLVLAMHSRVTAKERTSRACLYRFSAIDGKLKWRWPAEKANESVTPWFDASSDGNTIAVCAYQADGNGALILLDGVDGHERSRFSLKPLEPLVHAVSFWKSVSVAADGSAVYLIANDGRGWILRSGEAAPRLVVLGEPIPAGDVTILISGGGVCADGAGGIFLTGVSYLPWELSAGERPPQPHPAANMAIALDAQGERLWQLALPNLAQGVSLDRAGGWLFVGYASDPTYSPGGGSGLAIIDTHSEPRLAAAYGVNGSVANIDPPHADSLVLMLETVQRDAAGTRLIGANTLHVLRW